MSYRRFRVDSLGVEGAFTRADVKRPQDSDADANQANFDSNKDASEAERQQILKNYGAKLAFDGVKAPKPTAIEIPTANQTGLVGLVAEPEPGDIVPPHNQAFRVVQPPIDQTHRAPYD